MCCMLLHRLCLYTPYNLHYTIQLALCSSTDSLQLRSPASSVIFFEHLGGSTPWSSTTSCTGYGYKLGPWPRAITTTTVSRSQISYLCSLLRVSSRIIESYTLDTINTTQMKHFYIIVCSRSILHSRTPKQCHSRVWRLADCRNAFMATI